MAPWSEGHEGQDGREGHFAAICGTATATVKLIHDHTSLLVTSEDVSVFFDRCADVSLAARKQALISLTDLLTAR